MMNGTLQQINIDNLLNYSENPRHVVGINEKDTLRKLYDAVGTQYMLNLAEDIQKNGLLGNQQIVVVYSEELKRYIVYEGNRRIAAIKMLLYPEYFDFLDKPTIHKVKKVAENISGISVIQCYVAEEKEAHFIMERIHSGEDKGRGVKQWTPREKEVFKVRQSSEKSLSYLVDFYIRKYFNNFEITSILPFTTIQRIFNNREVKKKIGLEVTNEETFTNERMKLVLDASVWVLGRAESQGIAVTRLYNKARAIEDELLPWLERYSDSGMSNIDLAKEYSGEENKHIQASANNNPSLREEVVRIKPDDMTGETVQQQDIERDEQSGNSVAIGNGNAKNLPYFFQGLNYGSLNPNDANTHGISAVCRELQLYSDRRMVEKFPLSAAFLTRSVIEHALIFYSKTHKIQGQNKYIWENTKDIKKLSRMIGHYNKNLANYITNSEMRQYFTKLFGDYENNVDPLNWVVHRPSEFQFDSKTLIDLPRKGLLALVNYLIA